MSKSKHQLTRRDFVKVVAGFLGTVMGTVLGIPAISYIILPGGSAETTDTWISLGPLENYPIGIPQLFNFTRSQINGWEKTVNSYGVFVIRKNETELQVLSNICTHLGCRVSWQPDLQHYISPCHDGHFDITGNVLSGPPPRPLAEYLTKIEDGKLYIQYPPYERS